MGGEPKGSSSNAREGRGRYETRVWEPRFGSPRAGGKRARYRAFVPDSIGDFAPELSAATSALCERAGAAIRELNASSGGLRSLEGLAAQLLRSEALASSAIEELRISHRKLARAEAGAGGGGHVAREVLGNVRAMERAVKVGDGEADLGVEDILAIHRDVAVGPALEQIAGKLREQQGWIGGWSPPGAAFVPPPPEHVPRLMDDLCAFMNRDDISPVAQAAIAHAQFETIHPFGDGNGRVGRCLIHTLLRRRGVAPRYVPPVSLVLATDKDAYIAGLHEFRRDDVDRWVVQFAEAVEDSAEIARNYSRRVAELKAEWVERAEPMRSDSTARAILDHLPSHPIVTAAIAEQLTGRSRVAAINGLEHLHQAGILTRHRNQRKGDSWEAKELFAILGDFQPSLRGGSTQSA
jgi:Fic family protein